MFQNVAASITSGTAALVWGATYMTQGEIIGGLIPIIGGLVFYFFLFNFARTGNIALFKSENLLLNVLPAKIAALLKEEDQTIASHFEEASILFADMVGFSALTENLTPEEMIGLLNKKLLPL